MKLILFSFRVFPPMMTKWIPPSVLDTKIVCLHTSSVIYLGKPNCTCNRQTLSYILTSILSYYQDNQLNFVSLINMTNVDINILY